MCVCGCAVYNASPAGSPTSKVYCSDLNLNTNCLEHLDCSRVVVNGVVFKDMLSPILLNFINYFGDVYLWSH